MQTCPSDQELRDFSAARLPAERAGQLSAHLERCASCRGRLEQFESDGEALLIDVSPSEVSLLQRALAPESDGLDAGAPAAPVTDSIPGYQIVREIHRGGQGVVYQAVQKHTKRKVAIKVMKEGPFASRRDKARFEREVEILGQLNHPNIVGVHDSGLAAGSFFFVMDYISGQPLDEYIQSRRSTIESRNASGSGLSMAELLMLFAKICEAVNAAHLRGVIHRDLKPGNMRIDTEGEPHVLDFGLAKIVSGTDASVMTMTGQFMGSLPWASPEQAEGAPGKVDTRTDVYSLGVILYQMLTGRFPYEVVGNMRDVLDRIMHAEPIRPSLVAPALRGRRTGAPDGRIDDEVETIILKCLAKQRERRYQTAGELARDIQRYLNGETIEAKRDSAMYVLRKTLRRYRAAAMVVAGFGALIAVSAVVALGLWRQAVGQRNDAAVARQIAEEKTLQAQRAREEALREKEEANRQRKTAEFQAYLGAVMAGEIAFRTHETLSLVRSLDNAPAEYRNWEWNFLKASADQSVKTEKDKAEPRQQDQRLPECPASPCMIYQCTASSPDGKLIAETCGGGARVWDAVSYRELFRIDAGTDHCITRITFSPDSMRILTTSYYASVRRTDYSVTVSLPHRPDEFALWETTSGRSLTRIPAKHMTFASFGSGSRTVLTASEDGLAQLWDTDSGKELGSYRGHSAPITSFAFSPNGAWLVTGSEDETARLWQVNTGKEFNQMTRHDDSVTHVVFSPDGKRILLASRDRTATLWDVESGFSALFTLKGHEAPITDIGFSPDAEQIVTASADHTIRLWSTEDGTELVTLRGHDRAVDSAQFTADGRQIRSYSQDNTIKVWDTKTRDQVLKINANGSVDAAAFSPDGKWVLIPYPGIEVRVYGSFTGNEVLRIPAENVTRVAFSSDGSKILTGSLDHVVQVWDAFTGAEVMKLSAHGAGTAMAFSPDDRRIIAGEEDCTARIWDAQTGKQLGTLGQQTGAAQAAVYRSNGSQILTAYSNWATIWNATTSEKTAELEHSGGSIQCVAMSRDGRWILTGSSDATTQLWDARNYTQVLNLRGHSAQVNSVAFSPDGTRILTGSDDCTAKLWDRESGKEVATLREHTQAVMAVDFSSDGSRILTVSRDQNVCVWDRMPWAERSREREASAGRSAAGQPLGSVDRDAMTLIDNLWAVHGDWLEVADAIRIRSDLSEKARKTAMAMVLTRSYEERERFVTLVQQILSRSRQSANGAAEAVRQAVSIRISMKLLPKFIQARDLAIWGEHLLLAGENARALVALQAAVQREGTYEKSLGWVLLRVGRRDEAKAVFREAIKDMSEWRTNPVGDRADIDQWTAAYLNGTVSQEQYVGRWSCENTKGRDCCFPWFYVGQRMEIEGKRDEAIAAYKKSVELGKLGNAHYIHNWSAYRLGILTGTIQPPSSSPATKSE